MRLFLIAASFMAIIGFNEAVAQQNVARPQLALLIGNSEYPDNDAPLKEPVNDVRAVAEELRRLGFDVEVAENLSKEALQRTLTRFYNKIGSGSTALLYFSGYGVQTNQQTYLIPIDAQIWNEIDVRRDGVQLQPILSEISLRGAREQFVILDAARRNPFERRFRSFALGLAPVTAPARTLVMYSAAPGAVGSGSANDRGVFAAELTKQIRSSGAATEDMFNRTRIAVSGATHNEQVPWLASSLSEDAGGRPAVPAVSAPAQRPASPPNNAPVATPANRPSPPQPRPAPSLAAPTPPVVPAPAPAPIPSVSAAIAPAAPTAASPPALPAVKSPADDAAIKELETRIRANPRDGTSFYKRGQIYAGNGEYGQALKDFNEAINLNPNDVAALNNRCWVHAAVDELQPALRDCNRALTIQPQYAEALDSRGMVNLRLGMFAYAIADYDAALSLTPKLASALYGRGLAKMRLGNKEGGDSDIASAIELNPGIVGEFAGYGLR
jgi:hypothetical protein